MDFVRVCTEMKFGISDGVEMKFSVGFGFTATRKAYTNYS